jgi:hypothetical protein
MGEGKRRGRESGGLQRKETWRMGGDGAEPADRPLGSMPWRNAGDGKR